MEDDIFEILKQMLKDSKTKWTSYADEREQIKRYARKINDIKTEL